MVSSGMLSKLWAKDLVKKAGGVDAQVCHASLRSHTQAYHSISSTHTGVGTARRKVKKDWVSTDSQGIRKIFRAASIPNRIPNNRLYSRESTAMEMVSTKDERIRSILAKSR